MALAAVEPALRGQNVARRRALGAALAGRDLTDQASGGARALAGDVRDVGDAIAGLPVLVADDRDVQGDRDGGPIGAQVPLLEVGAVYSAASQALQLLDEYLQTRCVELAVHIEDLALSVGADVRAPGAAVAMAAELLFAAARQRHGGQEVLHPLARRERDLHDALRAV